MSRGQLIDLWRGAQLLPAQCRRKKPVAVHTHTHIFYPSRTHTGRGTVATVVFVALSFLACRALGAIRHYQFAAIRGIIERWIDAGRVVIVSCASGLMMSEARAEFVLLHALIRTFGLVL